MNRLVVAVIAIAGVIGALIALGATAQAKAVETHSSTTTGGYSTAAARSVGELASRTDWSWLDQDDQRGADRCAA